LKLVTSQAGAATAAGKPATVLGAGTVASAAGTAAGTPQQLQACYYVSYVDIAVVLIA